MLNLILFLLLAALLPLIAFCRKLKKYAKKGSLSQEGKKVWNEFLSV